MSADLIWQVLRTHNSHVVKRDGITLSGEPGNLANLHTYKFSGLANPLTVHVALKDKKIALTKNKSAAQQILTTTHHSVAEHRPAASRPSYRVERPSARTRRAVHISTCDTFCMTTCASCYGASERVSGGGRGQQRYGQLSCATAHALYWPVYQQPFVSSLSARFVLDDPLRRRSPLASARPRRYNSTVLFLLPVTCIVERHVIDLFCTRSVQICRWDPYLSSFTTIHSLVSCDAVV